MEEAESCSAENLSGHNKSLS